jgi:hypothetical protein
MTNACFDRDQKNALSVRDGINTEACAPVSWPAMPLLPVAWGDVFDKLTILHIKAEKLHDAAKVANVNKERLAIEDVMGDTQRFPLELQALVAQLQGINEALWAIEENKRDCERRQVFDQGFVELARQVYLVNDQRAAIKRKINDLLGSAIVEEKSHASRG